jgi:hypothetical protein
MFDLPDIPSEAPRIVRNDHSATPWFGIETTDKTRSRRWRAVGSPNL